jgi:hypothetical protein
MLFISASIIPPNCRFSAFIACKSRSWHSISHMDFLAWFVWEKNLMRAVYVRSVLHTSATRRRLYVYSLPIFICVTFSLDYKFGNTVIQCRSNGAFTRVTLYDQCRWISDIEFDGWSILFTRFHRSEQGRQLKNGGKSGIFNSFAISSNALSRMFRFL